MSSPIFVAIFTSPRFYTLHITNPVPRKKTAILRQKRRFFIEKAQNRFKMKLKNETLNIHFEGGIDSHLLNLSFAVAFPPLALRAKKTGGGIV